jgi:hypothetical protein
LPPVISCAGAARCGGLARTPPTAGRPVGALAERVPVRAVLACQAMRNRGLLLTAARAGGLMCTIWTAGACTHPSAHLMVDSPRLMQYQPPDIDEITGIDSDDTDQAGARAGSAQAPHK